MTLFCVRDGDAEKDNLIWNQPLKKVEHPKYDYKPKDQYKKTGTPGVVIDTKTGKMETQIPENEAVNRGLGIPTPPYLPDPKSALPVIEYNGDRLDWINNIFDAIEKIARGQIVRFHRWIIKGEVIEATRIFTEDVPKQVLDIFIYEKLRTRFYKHGVDAYFIDMSDAWFHIKNFPAFRHSLAEPKVQTYLNHRPALIVIDDIADRNSDSQDFSTWLDTPEVKEYQKHYGK